MTRKDYFLIAETLGNAMKWAEPWTGQQSRIEHTNRHMTVNWIAEKMASALQDDNPRFDRTHFLAIVRGEKELTSKPI